MNRHFMSYFYYIANVPASVMKILDTYFIIYCNAVRSILTGFIYYLVQFPQKKKEIMYFSLCSGSSKFTRSVVIFETEFIDFSFFFSASLLTFVNQYFILTSLALLPKFQTGNSVFWEHHNGVTEGGEAMHERAC